MRQVVRTDFCISRSSWCIQSLVSRDISKPSCPASHVAFLTSNRILMTESFEKTKTTLTVDSD